MKKLLIVLTLLLLLTACGQAEPPPEETNDYEALIAAAPVSQVEGQTVSPDGRFEIRAEGASGQYISGIRPPEFLQIVDRETGEVLWQDMGWLSQSILWSPEGGFAALARSARTYCFITIIETGSWAEWEFTLPDGSPIPEYTFLPDGEPWGVWVSEDSLDLTIGRGGDAGEQKYYICMVNTGDGKLEGIVLEESHEPLPGNYDFDQNGESEIVELVTVCEDKERGLVGWYELRVQTMDGRLCWTQSCSTAHAGWGSYFACRVDGEDYLLRYNPTMYQGFATYGYELFSLDETGREQVLRERSVNFDLKFGSQFHDSYDPEAIAAFLEEVHGLLEDSELLLTTERGKFRSGGSGGDFQDDLNPWTSDPLYLYNSSKSLEENIRDMGAYWKKQREDG